MTKGLIRALTVLLVLCGAGLAVIVLRPGRPVPLVPPPEASTAAAPQILGQFTALATPLPAPALAFTTRAGEPAIAGRFPRASGAGQCLGDVVRALRGRDAGARPAPGQARVGADDPRHLRGPDRRRRGRSVPPAHRDRGARRLSRPQRRGHHRLGARRLADERPHRRRRQNPRQARRRGAWDEPEMVATLRRTIAAR